MKLISRVLIACLALAVALCVVVSPASAAAKKKKEVVVVKHKHHDEGTGKQPIAGLNLQGKPGYFFSDTADTLQKSQIAGTGTLTFNTSGSAFLIPVGASYGITDKILVNVNSGFYAAGGASGIYYLNFGGKYGFGNVLKDSDSILKVAAGLDFSIGPLSTGIYGFSGFAFDPYGVTTWTLPDGLQFNGKLGLYVQNYSINTITGYNGITGQYTYGNVGFSYSYFQLDLGAAYPFDKELTGIAELALNGEVYGATGATPLLVGLRMGHDVQFQAMAGVDLGAATGLYLGAGVALFSE